MRKKIGVLGIACLTAMFMLSNTMSLFADDTSANISIGKVISNLKISGDMRLRQENYWRSAPNKVDRSRQRLRFRLGIEPEIQDVKVGFRLASGGSEQTSTNQSFDNLSSQKGIYIDLAYLQWKTFEWMKLSGGRMPNPLWTTYSSDLVWDADFNPEGMAEQFDFKLGERVGVFANFMQMVLDEDETSTSDQWLLAYQAGVKTKLFEESSLNFAAAYYDSRNENIGTLGQTKVHDGNTRSTITATALLCNYDPLHLSAEFKTKLWKWPFAIQADYVNNVADNSAVNFNAIYRSSGSAYYDQLQGFQVGATLGKAASKYSWEAAYYYKYLPNDATYADIADSDFGDGGTNRKGHIMWVAFAPRDYIQVKAKLLVTEVIRHQIAPSIGSGDNINRFQLDLQVKF